MNATLALGWNKAVGIPDLALYLLGGSIAATLEKGFSFFPSFVLVSKMIPPGIESTMMSLSTSIIILNQFLLRQLMGLIINDTFIHVTKKNMDNYIWLKVVCIVTSCIPLTYMWRMVPTLRQSQEL